MGRLKIKESGIWQYAGQGMSGYSGIGISGYSGYSTSVWIDGYRSSGFSFQDPGIY